METKDDNLIFTIKPDWVSWEAVVDCYRQSHEVNNQHGFKMMAQYMTAEELQDDMRDGVCFVALKGNNIIGTASVKYERFNKWWCIGRKVAYLCHAGIISDYQGSAVFWGLYKIRDKYIKESGVKISQLRTSEYNDTVIKLNMMRGFKCVQYSPTCKGADYYTVTMVRWEGGCPYSERFVKFMYNLSKFVAKTFWTSEYKFKYWYNRKE